MEIPYELLIKYCRKQTSSHENEIVEKWLADKDNLSMFMDMKNEWSYIHDTKNVIPDKQSLWTKISSDTYLNTKRKRVPFYSISAAAVIIILIISGTFLFTKKDIGVPGNQDYTTVSTRDNEKSKLQLADGTEIWLADNSTISFGNIDNTTEREVIAEGDLFFQVTPSDKKFVIHAGKITVEVLGTSFHLKTNDVDETFEISLKSGKVSVIETKNKKQLFVLDSVQQAIVDTKTMDYRFKNENTKERDTREQEILKIYDEPLNSIFEKLENWYGIDIISSGIDLSKHYTFQLREESLEEFLSLFSDLTPIKYTINDKKVIIQAEN